MKGLVVRQVKVRLCCQAIARANDILAHRKTHMSTLARRHMLHCNRISGYLTRPAQPLVVQPR
jgi:hypothetical protein